VRDPVRGRGATNGTRRNRLKHFECRAKNEARTLGPQSREASSAPTSVLSNASSLNYIPTSRSRRNRVTILSTVRFIKRPVHNRPSAINHPLRIRHPTSSSCIRQSSFHSIHDASTDLACPNADPGTKATNPSLFRCRKFSLFLDIARAERCQIHYYHLDNYRWRGRDHRDGIRRDSERLSHSDFWWFCSL